MSAVSNRLTTPGDFARAFNIADRLVEYELRMKWLPELMTKEVANDTVAALRQARDLVQHIFQSGYSLADMHRWVDMLVAADEEERGRVAAASKDEFAAPFDATPIVTAWEQNVQQADLPAEKT